jgi:hypothetical protein
MNGAKKQTGVCPKGIMIKMAKITVWKLGSLEHKIFPTTVAIDKFSSALKEALNNAVEGENTHLVWGPDIDVIQTDIEGKHCILYYDYDGNEHLLPVNPVDVEV